MLVNVHTILCLQVPALEAILAFLIIAIPNPSVSFVSFAYYLNHLFIYLFVYLYIYLFIYLFIYLSICLFIQGGLSLLHLRVYFPHFQRIGPQTLLI